ncbi:MAG: hypothetical protein R3A47_05030 [Polyangiales bacterium]
MVLVSIWGCNEAFSNPNNPNGGAIGVEATDAACSDGIDNDDDGNTDCDDFDCRYAVSCGGPGNKPGQCVPQAATALRVLKASGENTVAACSDGVDNDGDGYIDCDDFDCSKSNNPNVSCIRLQRHRQRRGRKHGRHLHGQHRQRWRRLYRLRRF